MKPHLRVIAGKWTCSDSAFTGAGATPTAAYFNLAKHHRLLAVRSAGHRHPVRVARPPLRLVPR